MVHGLQDRLSMSRNPSQSESLWNILFAVKGPSPSALHRQQRLGNLKRRLRLALDLVYRHAVRDLDERQALGEVDIKHALDSVSAIYEHPAIYS